ncbi:MAG: inorganic phosphate transporter [Oscillospiraceae bacterium]|nr:inorganic phosphate transporter [Oscillospiraceae bacterium]
MDFSFTSFLNLLLHNRTFFIISALTLVVIFINGWTDAPNAIITCVTGKCLSLKQSVCMAAIFNFLGTLCITSVNCSVTGTILNLANFDADQNQALPALCAALAAIVIWAVLAWFFGIPTSESHALIAALTGAAIALQRSVSAAGVNAWAKVFAGLALALLGSTVLGFLLTYISTLFARKHDITAICKKGQIVASACAAFAHGAQDGQKFIAIFILGSTLTGFFPSSNLTHNIPLWLIILCCTFISLGTLCGGARIIKKVGTQMVQLTAIEGFVTDIASVLCLLLATLTGLPVSTTHTKSSAMVGAALCNRQAPISWPIVSELVLTWLCTFPACGFLGFLLSDFFLKLI